MTWWQWLVTYLAAPFVLVALWIAACEAYWALCRWRARR